MDFCKQNILSEINLLIDNISKKKDWENKVACALEQFESLFHFEK